MGNFFYKSSTSQEHCRDQSPLSDQLSPEPVFTEPDGSKTVSSEPYDSVTEVSEAKGTETAASELVVTEPDAFEASAFVASAFEASAFEAVASEIAEEEKDDSVTEGSATDDDYKTAASEFVVTEQDAFEASAFKAVASEIVEEEPVVFGFKVGPSCEAVDVKSCLSRKGKRSYSAAAAAATAVAPAQKHASEEVGTSKGTSSCMPNKDTTREEEEVVTSNNTTSQIPKRMIMHIELDLGPRSKKEKIVVTSKTTSPWSKKYLELCCFGRRTKRTKIVITTTSLKPKKATKATTMHEASHPRKLNKKIARYEKKVKKAEDKLRKAYLAKEKVEALAARI